MLKRPVKKIFGLTILYSLIIIGIFVVQFKNESVISRNIGLLKVSLAQTQHADGTSSLKNTMQVAFKGISFVADDVTPAILRTTESPEGKNLTLLAWEQISPTSFSFAFTDDVSIVFSVSNTSQKAELSVSTRLPPDAESLSLTYKTTSGFSVTDQTKTRQLVSSRNIAYTMTAPLIEESSVSFSNASQMARYALYEPSSAFTFASVPSDTPLASETAYAETIKHIRDEVASISSATMQDSAVFTETFAVTYIAEQALKGHYLQAIEQIPGSIKNSSRRTYISAPFFNSLVAMYPSLSMLNDNIEGMIINAIAQKNLDIFSVSGIAEYMFRNDSDSDVRTLAALPARLTEFHPSVTQAAGILRVYLFLTKNKSDLHTLLEPIIPQAVKKIEDQCHFANQQLHVGEKESVSFLETIEIGKTLIDYGEFVAHPECALCGRLIVNTAFAQNTTIDLRAYIEVYPVLVQNSFYPHFTTIGTAQSKRIWAWTIARNINYERQGTEVTITIDFPQEQTHYIILENIPPFEKIEIYGMSYHTDPRFESYNSSGYVYNEQTQTLFLKSRHRVEKEIIRLSYR